MRVQTTRSIPASPTIPKGTTLEVLRQHDGSRVRRWVWVKHPETGTETLLLRHEYRVV